MTRPKVAVIRHHFNELTQMWGAEVRVRDEDGSRLICIPAIVISMMRDHVLCQVVEQMIVNIDHYEMMRHKPGHIDIADDTSVKK